MSSKLKYVQLEPGAFLSDHEFQAMTAEERGVYCTLIFYLYCNGGKCKLDHNKLQRITNCSGNFENVFQNVSGKFQVRRGFIYHKRVSEELKAAAQRVQAAREKAVKAAAARWQKNGRQDAPSNAPSIAKERKGNEIEKENKDTSNTNTGSQSFSSPTSVRTPSLYFHDALTKIIKPRSQSDRTCFRNVTNWLVGEIAAGRFDEQIFERVLDYAREAEKGRNPAAVFMALLQKELGYKKAG